MKDLVITSLCERLVSKGFESIQRRDREQSSIATRTLEDKLAYLETNLAERKTE